MFKRLLPFGVIVTLLGAAILFSTLSDDTVIVLNKILTQAEFRAAIWPVLLTSSMMLLGIGLLIYSVRHIMMDLNTSRYGAEAYGIITELCDNRTREAVIVDDVPEPKLSLLIIAQDGSILQMSEYFTDHSRLCAPGHFVRVKYTDRDVNILHRTERDNLPPEIANRPEEAYRNTACE